MISVANQLRSAKVHAKRALRRAATLLLSIVAVTGPTAARGQTSGEVVISQIYGGGGNSGAPFRNDFVELFNRGTNTVNLAGWSVQYASSASGNWQGTSLSNSIAPGQYFLLQLASGGANGVFLPPADATGTLSLSAGAGKVDTRPAKLFPQ